MHVGRHWQGMQSQTGELLSLQAGGPVRSSVAKPQHLTAVIVKPDGNGLFCPAFVQSHSFWGELKLGNSIQQEL